MRGAPESVRPGVIARLRVRYRWFDHVMRAWQRYRDCKGDFYAAGITYFTIFSLFPLLMVGFAGAGFVLAHQPQLVQEIEEQIIAAVPGDLGHQIVVLVNSAIHSRTSVGAVGLATAIWVGLGWMNNVREALSQMWEQRNQPNGFVHTKLSDAGALISVFGAIISTVGLTALTEQALMAQVLRWFGIDANEGINAALRILSLMMSWLVSWSLFTWMIARLPRESVSLHSSMRAGLIASVGFEIFKQIGAIYLRSVVQGPAGATFGPVLGLMVFGYITARLILFATAWAATSANTASALADQPRD